jgi:Crossover junction endodeoxyribonuclease RuvC
VRILGVDPGSITTGFGVVDCEHGRLSLVEQGSIGTPRGAELADRRSGIYVTDHRQYFETARAAHRRVFSVGGAGPDRGRPAAHELRGQVPGGRAGDL